MAPGGLLRPWPPSGATIAAVPKFPYLVLAVGAVVLAAGCFRRVGNHIDACPGSEDLRCPTRVCCKKDERVGCYECHCCGPRAPDCRYGDVPCEGDEVPEHDGVPSVTGEET